MKYTVLAFAYAAALLVNPATAIADAVTKAGACYSVADQDARAFCLARAHGESGRCYSIQRADLRAQCLAEVRR